MNRKPKKSKPIPKSLLQYLDNEERWEKLWLENKAKYFELRIKEADLRARMRAEGPNDFDNARSMEDIGRLLLQSVGLAEPSDKQISLAIKENNAFIARLEEIAGPARHVDEDDDDDVRGHRVDEEGGMLRHLKLQ